MPQITISQVFEVAGVPTNATSAVLSDETSTFGIKRNDTDAVVVADGTAMTHPSVGVYEYTFSGISGVSYTAFIEFVYNGDTYFKEVQIAAASDQASMACSYDSLVSRVGKEMFGIYSGFTSDQLVEILQCIQDGLNFVYDAYDWSFFRPLKDISTTAPYETGTVTIAAGVVTLVGGTFPSWAAQGILRVDNSYYSVASRDSSTQLTLNDTTASVTTASSFALGKPEVDLPDAFEAVAKDGTLGYYPDPNAWYPGVCARHDATIRNAQHRSPYFGRPFYYSIRTVEFDATVGSRKRLALYPTPDAAYVLRVPMILRPTMIDSTNRYPVGAETLCQTIVHACLSAVEIQFFEKPDGRHTRKFNELLPRAIAADREKSSPSTLGPDSPRGESYYSGGVVGDSDYERARRMGDITLDGVVL